MNIHDYNKANLDRFEKIAWDSIPSSPHADVKGYHLFVNAQYQNDCYATSTADDFVEGAGADVVAIVKYLMRARLVDGNESVCISLFVPAGSLRGRTLRVSVYNKDLNEFLCCERPLTLQAAIVTSEVQSVSQALKGR